MNDNNSINIPNLDILFKLSNPGCIALINEKDKKVYLNATNSMLELIERYTRYLKLGMFKYPEMIRDRDKLQFSILDTGKYNIRYYKYNIKKYYEWYKNNGYVVYNENDIKYIIATYTFYKQIRYRKVYLYLRGKNRGNKILVSTFKTMNECDEFINMNSVEDCLKMLKD